MIMTHRGGSRESSQIAGPNASRYSANPLSTTNSVVRGFLTMCAMWASDHLPCGSTTKSELCAISRDRLPCFIDPYRVIDASDGNHAAVGAEGDAENLA